jgi:hypothetical protein
MSTGARKKLKQFTRLVVAILRREPTGHIQDLWHEFTGEYVLCGEPPNQYLLHHRSAEIKEVSRD